MWTSEFLEPLALFHAAVVIVTEDDAVVVEPHSVVYASLGLTTLLPQFPKFWDQIHRPLFLPVKSLNISEAEVVISFSS